MAFMGYQEGMMIRNHSLSAGLSSFATSAHQAVRGCVGRFKFSVRSLAHTRVIMGYKARATLAGVRRRLPLQSRTDFASQASKFERLAAARQLCRAIATGKLPSSETNEKTSLDKLQTRLVRGASKRADDSNQPAAKEAMTRAICQMTLAELLRMKANLETQLPDALQTYFERLDVEPMVARQIDLRAERKLEAALKSGDSRQTQSIIDRVGLEQAANSFQSTLHGSSEITNFRRLSTGMDKISGDILDKLDPGNLREERTEFLLKSYTAAALKLSDVDAITRMGEIRKEMGASVFDNNKEIAFMMQLHIDKILVTIHRSEAPSQDNLADTVKTNNRTLAQLGYLANQGGLTLYAERIQTMRAERVDRVIQSLLKVPE